ncbi:MAG TPA: J domain-containing protein [Candidatus Limnocylindrales bacterium]|jgi:curved DNA-binding protein|nr:J domain-containing protein [Candidatus Limnocylindrales bacterium]
MEYRDYYATLGVPRTASPAEIKRAYRKLARQHHPDVQKDDPSAEKRFKEINEANTVLGDRDKRKLYDQLGANWEAYQQAGARPGATGADAFAGFGGFGGFGPGNIRVEYHGDPEDLAGFSDFFRTFFGGGFDEAFGGGSASGGPGGRRGRTTTSRRTARTGQGPIDLDDLLSGIRLGDEGQARRRDDREARRAPDVEAEAEISLEEAYRGATRLIDVGGRRLEVSIPKGIDSGQRIRLSGKGPAGADLYVRVRVRAHPVFARTGADLRRELPITLAEAILGAEVPVETLKGQVLLRIPPESQNGRTFRLGGQGMPRFRGEGHGDLYVRIRVVLPAGLDETARDLVRRLAEHVKQTDPRAARPASSSGERR